ncbi:hypothetical protein HYT23_04860 [Candidatus Pacearchaeota archaeon]|nr:hypothetical protein [Candidatus Pacearchaeota archaeon]
MKKRLILGLALFSLGVAVVLSSITGMTGFVISDNFGASINIILGLVPIVAGLIIIFSDRHRGDDDNYSDRMRGRDSLRAHNEEAHHRMIRRYISEHGREPSKQELKEYIRKYHETDELADIMDEG